MSIEQTAQAPAMPAAPEPIRIATLEGLKAKLQERKTVDASKLPTFHHEELDETYRIGPISNEGYDAIEKAGANKPLADLLYLLHGIYEPKLDREVAQAILGLPYGSSTRALINAIKDHNPPREYLMRELQLMIGFNAATVVLFRVLEGAGLFSLLKDYLVKQESDPVCQAAAYDLKEWEDALPAFEAWFGAKDTAQRMGITIYDAMTLDDGSS